MPMHSSNSELILVVEDDRTIALLERHCLQRAGYGVTTVATSEEAIERVAQGGVSLVVLDYSLAGGETGLDLYRDLRARGHDLPVILVTGYSDEATVIAALRAGVRDFVTKSTAYLEYLPESVGRVLQQVRVERRLEESEARFRATFEQAAVGIAHIAPDGSWLLVNQRLCLLLGYTREELAARTFRDLTHPDDLDDDSETAQTLIDGVHETLAREKRYLRKDGTPVWVNITVSLVRDPEGQPGYFICVVEDISTRKQAEERLVYQAFHDPLTDLPNRALFMDRLGHALARYRRSGLPIGVLFLDLDRFKTINDSLGHAAGDQLLVTVGSRLKDCVRAADTVARLGGDEFAVLLENLQDIAVATQVAERIQEALVEPFELAGHEIFTTASMGIALSEHAHQPADELLRDADIALYRAKARGRARFDIFDPAMYAAALAELQIEADLRRAIERDEMVVYYQPVRSIDDSRIMGVEALLRWQHPVRGLVPPMDFIPLAEETGLILPIGQWILRTACAQTRAWHEAGLPPFSVAVNLSARQLRDRQFATMVAQVLAETGLEPRYLQIELTESRLMENVEVASATLKELSELGVSLSIDDFGTGHSSLGRLRHFPIATLKIDRSFVHELTLNSSDAAIAGAIIAMAHRLGLTVVAEGVETEEQLAFLQAQHCDAIQGYLYSPPLPPHALTAFLSVTTQTEASP